MASTLLSSLEVGVTPPAVNAHFRLEIFTVEYIIVIEQLLLPSLIRHVVPFVELSLPTVLVIVKLGVFEDIGVTHVFVVVSRVWGAVQTGTTGTLAVQTPPIF